MPAPTKLKRLFPHASRSFLEANPDLESRLQNPLKQSLRLQPLDQVPQGKEKGYGRPHLCITSFALRLTDEDNLKGGCKALIDCLRTLNLIDNDDPKSLELTVKQIKVRHRHEERTIVRIQYDLAD